ALLESKGAKQMIDQLLAGPATDEAYVEQWFGSVVRENALHLFAWSLHQPQAPRVDELALELFARRSNGHWSTTQGNAWSLLALASYLRNVENGSHTAAGTIAWGDAKKTFALSPSAPLAQHVFPLEPATVRAPLTIAKTGDQVFS
ncbi:MAG: hypothetical protein ABI883_09580, partial [Chthoniobacterales bacterium]